ncbi:MAG: YfiR family protein [Flavobacterium sp.]|nr:MAG: YfiR family protein [Flavobacterium sp.]
MQSNQKLRHNFLQIALFVIGFLFANQAQAQYTRYEVRAGFIYTFAQNFTWPDIAFARTNKYIVGVLGENPFGNSLERILKGRSANGRYFEVRYGTSVKELRGCNVVFITYSEKDRAARIIEEIQTEFKTEGIGVLTIGDEIPNFCQYGGILNIPATGIAEFNPLAAEKSKLVVSPKLFKILTIVK